MSNNHLPSQRISFPYSNSLNSYSALFPEELEWDNWGDEMFVFKNQEIPESKQPEPKTNLTFLTLSTIFLILVTVTWAKASPRYNELPPTDINSATELIKLITNFE